MVDWATLNDAFLVLNQNCGGNLGVVMSACHGLHAIRPLALRNPAPYYFLLGPEHVVSAGLLEREMPGFYRRLIESSNLTAAAEGLDPALSLFMADRFFYVAFGKYLKNACIGRKGTARMERLVGEAIAAGIEAHGENLRSIRGAIKARLRSQREPFDRISRRFLHGSAPVSYDDFLRFVRSGLQGGGT